MGNYNVQNLWFDGSFISGPSVHPGGMWVLGCRNNQNVVTVDISSLDNGQTLTGKVTYANEGPIGFKGNHIGDNRYKVQVQWGGDSAPWHDDGIWTIGARDNQRCIALNVVASNDGNALGGHNTYANEGAIFFVGVLSKG